MLINHFWLSLYDSHRAHLGQEGQLAYALFDFDAAMMLKPGQRRLPSHLSWIGGISPPDDTSQGELDYDPFAFDVGCLGVLITMVFKVCHLQGKLVGPNSSYRCAFLLQQICPYAPLLAPLMDNMVTPNIQDRFTASQALRFFEDLYPQLTLDQLNMIPPRREIDADWSGDTSTRWDGLPEQFVQKWSIYRLPPTPLSMKILKRICDPDWGLELVQGVRRAIRVFSIIFGPGRSKMGLF